MKIRMRTNSADSRGPRLAGKTYDVDDKEGRGLIDGGFARPASAEDVRAERKKKTEDD
jgi:hypothetical protein